MKNFGGSKGGQMGDIGGNKGKYQRVILSLNTLVIHLEYPKCVTIESREKRNQSTSH